jgi:hypothetical protein
MTTTPAPIDDGRGAIAHWFDWALGRHWSQRVQSLGGYIEALALTLAGGQFGASFKWGIPIIDRHWNQFVCACLVIAGVSTGIKSRMVKSPPQEVSNSKP